MMSLGSTMYGGEDANQGEATENKGEESDNVIDTDFTETK